MVKTCYIKISILLLIFLSLIFGPIFLINKSYLSVFDYLLNSNDLVLILYANILLFLIFGFIFLSFFPNKNYINIIGFLVLVISIVMFFTFPYVLSLTSGLNLDIINYSGCFLIYIIVFLYFLFTYLSRIFGKFALSIQDICEIGILVGMALVLDLPMFKIKIGSSGGSISFSCLPLIVLALRKGFVKSFLGCGIIFGFVSCLLDGYGLFTYPFDYLLGFGAVSVVGLFNGLIFKKNKFSIMFLIVGILLFGFIRLSAATLSGIIYYNLSFIPSLIYQLPYILPSLGICLVCSVILYPVIGRINKRFK